MLKVSDETLFSGQPPGSSHLSVPRGTPEGNLRTCLPNKVEGLIAGYPEGGRLLRFMINCMDKISSVSNEGLWGIRLLTNQHRVDSTDRERTWASIRGYSSLCRQQWNEVHWKETGRGVGGSVGHWNNIWALLWSCSGKPWNRWGRHRDMVHLKCVNCKRRNYGWQVKYNLM